MITIADLLLFCDRTLDGMERSLDRLDDTTVNERPELPAPNSPFQLVTHALAAARYWTSHVVLGRPSDRVRDEEFVSSGSVVELRADIASTRALLHELGPELAAARELSNEARTRIPLDESWTVGAALIHTYEELAQHLGHLEITVDLVEQTTEI